MSGKGRLKVVVVEICLEREKKSEGSCCGDMP